jgi:hypothetical protein
MSCEVLEKTLGIPESKILHIVRLRARCIPHDEIVRTVGGISEKHIESIVEIIESNDHVLRPKYVEHEKEWKASAVKTPIAQRQRQFEMYQELYDQAQEELKKLDYRQSHLKGPRGATDEVKKEFVAKEMKRCEDMRIRYMDVALNALDSARKATAEPLSVDKAFLHAGNEKDMVEKVLQIGKGLMENNVITKEEWMGCLPLAMLNRTQ